MDDNIEKLKQMVGRCRVGMLGIPSEGGNLHFSPMSHVDIDDDGNLWFFTSKETSKELGPKNNANIHITYTQESNSLFLSIEGTAHLNANKEKMRELFNPYVKAWFPKGLDDPAISLLVVEPKEVEYWTSDDRKILTYNKMLATDNSEKNISQNGL